MGTRGTVGFHHKGEDYLTYNHFDSYPEGLGEDTVKQINTFLSPANGQTLDDLRKLVDDLKFVGDQETPTPEDEEKFREFTDLNVGGSKRTWYQLLRRLQGDIISNAKAGVMILGNDFIYDSLFCEFGYIINLDDETFEVYRGFQNKPHDKGRYTAEPEPPAPYENGYVPDTYYGCALVATFPLADIPKDWAEKAFSENEE